MSNITVTVELCQEDRVRLDKILEALTTNVAGYVVGQLDQYITGKQVRSIAPEVAAAPAPVEDEPVIENQPTEDTTPVEEPVEVKETPAAEPELPTVAQADVQKKVVALSAAGKKDAVKEIVQKYAPRVSAIPEDKLAEVWQKLTALEG